MYEELIDKLLQELWRVLHFPAEINQFLLNSFCLTHVRDGNTYVQTHAIPNSSSDNCSGDSMSRNDDSVTKGSYSNGAFGLQKYNVFAIV